MHVPSSGRASECAAHTFEFCPLAAPHPHAVVNGQTKLGCRRWPLAIELPHHYPNARSGNFPPPWKYFIQAAPFRVNWISDISSGDGEIAQLGVAINPKSLNVLNGRRIDVIGQLTGDDRRISIGTNKADVVFDRPLFICIGAWPDYHFVLPRTAGIQDLTICRNGREVIAGTVRLNKDFTNIRLKLLLNEVVRGVDSARHPVVNRV